jgi:hypothetical protein
LSDIGWGQLRAKTLSEAIRRKRLAATANKLFIPTNDEELKYAIELYTGIDVPDRHVCPHHTTPFRAVADAYFARYPITVWKASRGLSGKSVSLAVLSYLEGIILGASVNLLGGSGQQSSRVHGYMTGDDTNLPNTFWGSPDAPRFMLVSDPTQRNTRLTNRGRISVLMASQTSVRGPHPQRLRLDEVDEMNLKILDAALGQPMDARGISSQTVLSSTHQNPNGTMTEVLRRAALGHWPVYQWCIDGNSTIMSPCENKPIKDIRIGDIVYAYKDGRIIETKVTDAWSNGIRSTVIVSAGGRKIRCTPEHKFLTNNGWVRADGLVRGSTLFGMREENEYAWKSDQKRNRGVREMQNKAQTGNKLSRKLSDMWQSKAIEIKNLSKMLSQGIIETQPGTGRNDGSCQRKFRQDCQEKPQQYFSKSERIVRLFSDRLSGRGAVWQVFSRFCNRFVEGLHRSKWNILAFETGTNKAGYAEIRDSSGIGIQSDNLTRSKNSSVVHYIVESVEPSDNVEVFDITVKEGESFVCEGIVVHNCYKETEGTWLDPSMIEKKRGEVTSVMWKTEYELEEPSAENRAIMPEMVELMFDPRLGRFQGAPNEYIEIEKPNPNGSYSTGADWAKQQDWTIVLTLRTDVVPMKLVAFERTGRKPWPVMVKVFNNQINRFKSDAAHDITGIGDVVSDYIEGDASGIILGGRRRDSILTEYVAAVESHKIIAPRIEWMYSEHKFAAVNDLYGSGHLPDTICAGALALHAAGSGWAWGAGG